MQTSPAGRAFIGLHEGLRLDAYRDAVGVWTIGYGHTAAAGAPAPIAGMRITAGEADAILARDLAKFDAAVGRLVTVDLQQHEFDALASFTFNLGEGNLAASTLLRKPNAGDRAGAAAEFARWNKAGGKVLAGLTRRRAQERALFTSGTYAGVPASVPRVAGAPADIPEALSAEAPVIGENGRTIARLNLRKAPIDGAVQLTLEDDWPVEVVGTWHRVKAVIEGHLVEGWVSGVYVDLAAG